MVQAQVLEYQLCKDCMIWRKRWTGLETAPILCISLEGAGIAVGAGPSFCFDTIFSVGGMMGTVGDGIIFAVSPSVAQLLMGQQTTPLDLCNSRRECVYLLVARGILVDRLAFGFLIQEIKRRTNETSSGFWWFWRLWSFGCNFEWVRCEALFLTQSREPRSLHFGNFATETSNVSFQKPHKNGIF